MKPAFSLEIAKIVGTPSDGFWSQVHTFFPEDADKKEKRGDLLAVLVLSGAPDGIEAVAAGREVLSRLHEEYYGNLEGSAFEKLSRAIKKVGEENEKLEIVAAVFLGPVLYIATYGEGRIVLKRGEKTGILLKGEKGLKIKSGLLNEGDMLIFGSKQFFEVVDQNMLKTALENSSLSDSAESLAAPILGRSGMANVAAILVSISAKDPDIKPVETLDEDKMFLVSNRENARKKINSQKLLIVCFCLLGLLLGSLALGWKRQIVYQNSLKANDLIKQAEEKLNQSKNASSSKPAEARSLAEEAKKLVDDALKLKTKDNAEIIFVQEQVEKHLSSLQNEIALTQPTVFMDLSLFVDNAEGKAFSTDGKRLLILDSQKRNVYFLNIEKKSHEIINYPGEEGINIAYGNGKTYILDSKGIFEINALKNSSLAIPKPKEWENAVDIAVFGSNIYILDEGSGAIWRHSYLNGEYLPAKNWFLQTNPDLSESFSFAIDGAIWILKKNNLLKFNLGKQESFTLSKAPESLEDSVAVFTSSENKNLYILDRNRAKIYVFDKNGEFKAAYAWEGLKEAKDLIADESTKRLFILTQTKIFETPIK